MRNAEDSDIDKFEQLAMSYLHNTKVNIITNSLTHFDNFKGHERVKTTTIYEHNEDNQSSTGYSFCVYVYILKSIYGRCEGRMATIGLHLLLQYCARNVCFRYKQHRGLSA